MRHRLGLLVGMVVMGIAWSTNAAEYNQVLLIDTFDDETTENCLQGETQGDEENIGGCIPVFTQSPAESFGHFGHSLKLTYDVTAPNSFSFYWSRLDPHEGQTRDLSGYNYLSFWYKTDDRDQLNCSIEIHKDSDGDGEFRLGKDMASKLFLAKYTRNHAAGVWHKVVIPFADFSDITAWNSIYEIVFVFENNRQSGKGTVYFDDLLVGSRYPDNPEKADDYFPGRLRESLFTVNDRKVGTRFVLGSANTFKLLLKNMNPLLECVRIEASENGIQDWMSVCSFYDHATEHYTGTWQITAGKKTFYFLQIVVADIFGHEKIIGGPFGGTYLPEEQ